MSRRVAVLALALAALPASRAQAQDNPFVGEVRIFAFNFCPQGWATADGSLLAIAEDETLFALIGAIYGGDGQVTFAVPDLRGRVPIAVGTGAGLTARLIGEQAGAETVTLIQSQLPSHTHLAGATTLAPNATHPGDRLPAQKSRTPVYRSGNSADALRAADAVGPTGGSQPVDNTPPYTTFTICMSRFGIFPTQN